jgi:hypothetical protein
MCSLYILGLARKEKEKTVHRDGFGNEIHSFDVKKCKILVDKKATIR